MKKRLLAVLLTLCMMLSIMPVSVFAAEEEDLVVKVQETLTLEGNAEGTDHKWDVDDQDIATVEWDETDGSTATVTGLRPGTVIVTHTYTPEDAEPVDPEPTEPVNPGEEPSEPSGKPGTPGGTEPEDLQNGEPQDNGDDTAPQAGPVVDTPLAGAALVALNDLGAPEVEQETETFTVTVEAGNYVALIETVDEDEGNSTVAYYENMDDAVQAANGGDTIELLADATTSGLNLRQSLTIKGSSGLTEKPTLAFVKDGIALWGVSLSFVNCRVVMNGIGSTPYGEWNWMSICASTDASLTLDKTEMTMDASDVSNSPHAIYFCSNNKLNIENNSTLTIKNYPQDALEWDGGDGGYNVNITDSKFISDHNRSGFTGTFYATIQGSEVSVTNTSGMAPTGLISL